MWEELGIGPTRELEDIKRAYGDRLKTCHPEDDPEGFQRLYAAFQAASRFARMGDRAPASPYYPNTPQQAGETRAVAEDEEQQALSELIAKGMARQQTAGEETQEGPIDFQTLIGNGLRAEKMWKIRVVLAHMESLMGHTTEGGDGEAGQKAWQAYLDSPEFRAVMRDEEMLDALCRLLRGHPRLSSRVYMALYSVYGFNDDPRWSEDLLYSELYGILQPCKKKLDAARAARLAEAERVRAEQREAQARVRARTQAEYYSKAQKARRAYRRQKGMAHAYLTMLVLGFLYAFCLESIWPAVVVCGHRLVGVWIRDQIKGPAAPGKRAVWRVLYGLCLTAFCVGLGGLVLFWQVWMDLGTAMFCLLPILMHGLFLRWAIVP